MVITIRIQSSVPVEARHGKYFAVGESGVSRVPTAGIHVGHTNPGIGIKIEDICVRLGITVEEMVTYAKEQAAVWMATTPFMGIREDHCPITAGSGGKAAAAVAAIGASRLGAMC